MTRKKHKLHSLSPVLPLSAFSASGQDLEADSGQSADGDISVTDLPEAYSVSEISSRLKSLIEGHFDIIRVRGELGRVSRPSSGHLYFDLKDSRNVLSAVSWRSSVARFDFKPEEGLEVIATGRLTTYGGQSRYQLLVEFLEISGEGALMALLERRKRALSAEGLFSSDRKAELPFLPSVIGIVTSPTGAVIRDILHRLSDRFPREVIIWPVRVQGEGCGTDVAGAVYGFDSLPEGGIIPRPDLLIIARGGGSVEDLWGFNDELVIRAVSECRIPVISAVGHETDWTLLDLVADVRCPTPSAAAERAVPVRSDLFGLVGSFEVRLRRHIMNMVSQCGVYFESLLRLFPEGDSFLSFFRQRLDDMGLSLWRSILGVFDESRLVFSRISPRLSARLIVHYLESHLFSFHSLCVRFDGYIGSFILSYRRNLDHFSDLLSAYGYRNILRRGFTLVHSDKGGVVTSSRDLVKGDRIGIEFHDGSRSGYISDDSKL